MSFKKIGILCVLSAILFPACDDSGVQAVVSSCQPNETKCTNNTIYICNDSFNWTQTDACPNGCADDGKSCLIPLNCQTGELKCSDDTEYICIASHEWKQVKSCENRGCSSSGKCNPKDNCSAGETVCNEGKIWKCSSQSTWELKAVCMDAQCSLDGKKCLNNTENCIPDDTKCTDGREYLCDSAQTWKAVGKCDDDGCDINGKTCASKSAACTPGEKICVENYEKVCNDNHHWEKVVYCGGHGCNAENNSCDKSTCTTGDIKCIDNAMYRCNDEPAWEKLHDCGVLGCTENGKNCYECMAGVSVCSQDTVVALCNQNNQYYETTCNNLGCANPYVCNIPNSDQFSYCTPGERKCDDSAEYLCDASQNWRMVRTCKSNECTSDMTLCKETDIAPLNDLECTTKDDLRCENDIIYHCTDTNGQLRWTMKTDCSGYGCHTTQEIHFCSLPEEFINPSPCTAGDIKCSEDIISICTGNGIWLQAKSCNGKGCASATECN